jgi:hypothetical protein
MCAFVINAESRVGELVKQQRHANLPHEVKLYASNDPTGHLSLAFSSQGTGRHPGTFHRHSRPTDTVCGR